MSSRQCQESLPRLLPKSLEITDFTASQPHIISTHLSPSEIILLSKCYPYSL